MSGDGIYRANCEDCSWSYSKDRRGWVESAAANHESVYRNVEGHDTHVHKVNSDSDQEGGSLVPTPARRRYQRRILDLHIEDGDHDD